MANHHHYTARAAELRLSHKSLTPTDRGDSRSSRGDDNDEEEEEEEEEDWEEDAGNFIDLEYRQVSKHILSICLNHHILIGLIL